MIKNQNKYYKVITGSDKKECYVELTKEEINFRIKEDENFKLKKIKQIEDEKKEITILKLNKQLIEAQKEIKEIKLLLNINNLKNK